MMLFWHGARSARNPKNNISTDIPKDNCSSNIAAPNKSLFKKIRDKLEKIFKK